MQELLKNNKKIFLCCDANIAHNEIDVNKPKETSKKSGFLLEERRIIDEILEIGFVDTFRELNKSQIQYILKYLHCIWLFVISALIRLNHSNSFYLFIKGNVLI